MLDTDALLPSAIAERSHPALRRITLLVVDEQPVVQLGVRLVAAESERRCEIIEADSGIRAVAAAREHRPDVVLLDPFLEDMMLTEVVGRIRAVSPASRVVVFAGHVSPSLRDEAVALGVHGLLGKATAPDRFRETVERVITGEILLEAEGSDVLRRAAAKLNCTPLTPREHEIIRRAARGESNAEIASAIFLAPTTVKSYVQSALGKLEARNRVEAVFKLSELRLL
jgi:two-component system nitrate/nitrite response regulator NarL